jgi:hypothetical protein
VRNPIITTDKLSESVIDAGLGNSVDDIGFVEA